MSHENFSVGEIAIYWGAEEACAAYNGQECTVASAYGLRFPRSARTGQVVPTYGYLTIAQDGKNFTCRPDQLRKRRPPQEWQKLCDVETLPVEAPERELEIA